MHITRDNIEEAMDMFEFGKIEDAMNALNWEWHDTAEPSVPELYELRRTARDLVQSVLCDPCCSEIASGGFRVRRDQLNRIVLTFEIDRIVIGEPQE